MWSSYKGVFVIVSRYWKAYGGFTSLFQSPYLHCSFILTVVSYPYWSENPWWNDVLSISPSIVGFSLGGYAIWLAFGDEKFKSILSHTEEDEKLEDDLDAQDVSPFMSLNATFAHFIIFQLIALITAAIYKWNLFASLPVGFQECFRSNFPTISNFYKTNIHHAVGYFLFLYSLFTAFAATFAVFRISSWLDMFQRREKSDD